MTVYIRPNLNVDVGYSWFPESPSDHRGFEQLHERDKNAFMIGWERRQAEVREERDFDNSLEGSASQIIEFHEGNLEELDFEQFKQVTFAILIKMNEELENK